jgi:hypothetical protein
VYKFMGVCADYITLPNLQPNVTAADPRYREHSTEQSVMLRWIFMITYEILDLTPWPGVEDEGNLGQSYRKLQHGITI